MSLILNPLFIIRQCVEESLQRFNDGEHHCYSVEDGERLEKCYNDILADLPGALRAALEESEKLAQESGQRN